MNKMVRTLIEKIKAGYPALYLQTSEEERVLAFIDEAAKETDRKVWTWLFQDGLVSRAKTKGAPQRIADTADAVSALREIAKLDQNTIVVLRLFHHHLDVMEVMPLFYDLLPKFKATRRQIIITAPTLRIPPDLEKVISLVEMDLPTTPELYNIVDNMQTNIAKPDDEIRRQLAENARGLTWDEAESAIALSMIRPNLGKDSKKDQMIWDPKVVRDEKCETVKKTGYLHYQPATGHSIDEIGGLSLFKKWIERKSAIFKNYDNAMKFGCDVPKGVLMLGVPGTGKSLGAKATADAFQLPLIRVDMGAIFGGIVGQSEANARAVIRFLEAVAPCVGWLDEVEKGFAGSSGGQLDSGVGARVLSTFLTWMQEKTAPVFVYATANNVASLPPELLRKGRFDEMFYVALPNQKEREEIFKIHITKRGRAEKIGKQLDLKQLAAMTKGFAGAEIESVVKDSIEEAFFVQKDLNMFDLQESISNTVPLGVLMKDSIAALSTWSQGRTRPANTPEETGYAGSQDRTVEA